MISVYSDGSSAARGGKPGGWGWVIVRDDVEVLAADYGGDPSTTNNVMELTGAIKGLEAAAVLLEKGTIKPGELIELVSDSQYCLGLASGGYTPSANLELAKRIKELHDRLKVRTRWVRGHQGNVWNERTDSLAGKGKNEAILAPPPIPGTRWIRLTRGRFALIDEGDLSVVSAHQWHCTSAGYAASRIDNRIVYMHRFLLNPNDGQQVDHIDHDRLNNRRDNLRLATNQENARNKSKAAGLSSKYKGVHYRDDSNVWRAYIDENGSRMYLGNFSNEEDAARAYDAAATQRFGRFAALNFAEVTAGSVCQPSAEESPRD